VVEGHFNSRLFSFAFLTPLIELCNIDHGKGQLRDGSFCFGSSVAIAFTVHCGCENAMMVKVIGAVEFEWFEKLWSLPRSNTYIRPVTPHSQARNSFVHGRLRTSTGLVKVLNNFGRLVFISQSFNHGYMRLVPCHGAVMLLTLSNIKFQTSISRSTKFEPIGSSAMSKGDTHARYREIWISVVA